MTHVYSCIAAVVLCFGASAAAGTGELLASADSMFAARRLYDAAAMYDRACTQDPASYEAAWKSARAYADLGENTKERRARGQWYQKGLACARRAVALDNKKPEGYLYSFIVMGRMALDTVMTERIRMGRKILLYMDTCLMIDPDNHVALNGYGSWHRSLCELNRVERTFANMFMGPRAVSSKYDTAAAAFKKAVAAAPHLAWHHVDLARTYELMGKREEALREYETAVTLSKPGSRYRAEAERRLAGMKKK